MGYPLSDIELKYLLLGERLGDGFVMYKEAFDYTSPLSAMVYKWLDVVFGRSRGIHHFLSTVVVFFNAVVLNLLLVRNRAYLENNYLPGFFYVLFSLAIPDFFTLSPQLMSSTFILLALNNVFRRVDNQATDELFLFAGLYTGIAALFYVPAVVFFLVFLISLLLFSTAIARRILLYFYGSLIPFVVAFAYFFWFDTGTDMLIAIFGRGLFSAGISYITSNAFWLAAAIPAFWLVISVLLTLAKGKYGIYESKIMQIMILYGIAGVVCILVDVEFSANQIVLFLPVLAYFLTYYVITVKRRLYKLTLPSIIVLSLLGAHFYQYRDGFQGFAKVERPDMGFTNRGIMILGEDLDGYHRQRIYSPFIDPVLSKEALEPLNYYRKSSELFKAIYSQPPEVIIDRWDAMDQVMDRFPLLEERYRQGTSGRYFLISEEQDDP